MGTSHKLYEARVRKSKNGWIVRVYKFGTRVESFFFNDRHAADTFSFWWRNRALYH